ncbi:MAG: hypothetical protein JEZ09_08435 [Salinivirgaceae bacterium]|nr:hypothetical protein [Salinivirgaceae bacterium]
MKIQDLRHIKLTVLMAISLLLLQFSCNKPEENKNIIPICSIITPENGAEITKGDIVHISVNADDTDGNIAEVKFYIDKEEVASINSLPFDYEWITAEENIGNHKIRVIASDNVGDTIGAEITVNIIVMHETGTVTDYDGNTYNTIKIGNQWWMAENLKTTHYADGSEIPLVESKSDWSYLGDSLNGYCFYDNLQSNADTYGVLYTWSTAMNGEDTSTLNPSGVQGVCPDGWHLPSYTEWEELIDYLGGFSVAGGKLKEVDTILWISPNYGATNESGFSALPAGVRHQYNAEYILKGYVAQIMCCSGGWSYVGMSYEIRYDNERITWDEFYRNSGISVRCVKD